MNKEKRKKFKEYRDIGKWNYILTYGGRYAILMFLGMWFFTKFILEEVFYVGLNMVLWGIGGLIIGLWGWHNINKELSK